MKLGLENALYVRTIFSDFREIQYCCVSDANCFALYSYSDDLAGLQTEKVFQRSYFWPARFLWIWTGLVYHLLFFTQINNAAYVFASLFILQGLLFCYEGIAKKRLGFCFEMNSYGIIGAIISIYALLIYPLLGYLSGRIYPASPTFGAPCPTTIFTFGLLLWTNQNASLHLLIIPLTWTLIGSFAYSVFGVGEDLGLLVAGILALILLLRRKFRVRDKQIKTNVMP